MIRRSTYTEIDAYKNQTIYPVEIKYIRFKNEKFVRKPVKEFDITDRKLKTVKVVDVDVVLGNFFGYEVQITVPEVQLNNPDEKALVEIYEEIASRYDLSRITVKYTVEMVAKRINERDKAHNNGDKQ